MERGGDRDGEARFSIIYDDEEFDLEAVARDHSPPSVMV